MRSYRRYLFSTLLCIAVLASLSSANKIATTKPILKPPLLRTATKVSQGHDFSKLKVKREIDSRRLKSLRSKNQLIASYLAAVDKSVMSLLKQSTIPNMTRNDWKTAWRTRPQPYQAFSASLWKETRPKNRYVRLHLHCNIYCDDGSVHTAVSPSLQIRKPARDLCFDWHVNTGNPSLDQQIEDIAIREAKNF